MAGQIARLLTSTIAALTVCNGMAGAAEPAVKPVYITADRMLDVATGAYVPAPALVVEGGRITKLGNQSTLSAPADSVLVDLKGMTILPGLIDMHVHLTGDADKHGYAALADGVADQVVSGAHNAHITLLAGFTTVRNVGAEAYTDIALRRGINEGKILGPRIAGAGEAIGATGGHCDSNLLPVEAGR